MVSNKDISVAELARVIELDEVDQRYIPDGYPPSRAFRAECADGSVCHVTSGGYFQYTDCYCSDHYNGSCEGCVRVMCVLTDERLQKLKMSLVGFALTPGDNPALQLMGK